MSGLGHDHGHVGVGDVAQQALTPSGVVETDDGGPAQRRTAKSEQIVGHVVEQNTDVERTSGRAPGDEEVRPTPALRHVVTVGPHALAEAHRGSAGDVGVRRVPPEEGRGVGGGQRRRPRSRRVSAFRPGCHCSVAHQPLS